jgi:hypothetical protein
VTNEATAILFRVMGHHSSGRRIRLLGSYLAHGDDDAELVLDLPAYAAQQNSVIVDYGQIDIGPKG